MKPGNACPKAHVGEVEYLPPIPIDITPKKVATSTDTVLSGLDKEDDNIDTSSDDNEMPWTLTTGPTKSSLFEDSGKKLWKAIGQSSSDNKVEKPNGTNMQPRPQRSRTPPGQSRPPSGPSEPPSAPSGLPPVLSTAATVHFYHYDMPTASGNILVASTSALAGYPKIMNMVVRAKVLQDQFFGHSGSADCEILVNISFLNWHRSRWRWSMPTTEC
ncbi:hypothetical protein BG006_011501 [Podila minutissima]|uniref:Uncharacterized protein n=1 Tax=Podila minutissima TaxID=64525 RepID=A0A9P5VI26_9FUNG|nr:hypothetical protein BG006_011501 [Podila minutissima]